MEELKMQTIGDLLDGISTGDIICLPSTSETYDEIFRRTEEEAIQERSRRASAYHEAAKIYLTF
ncbi:MAG: hypothetical protein K6G18_09750 [Treponema sp.]|nr:hypothetical protein [Treponema sp.]